MSEKHSPLPWREDEEYPGNIEDANGKQVAFVEGDRTSFEQDKENIGMILHRVNSYDAIVEAMEMILEDAPCTMSERETIKSALNLAKGEK